MTDKEKLEKLVSILIKRLYMHKTKADIGSTEKELFDEKNENAQYEECKDILNIIDSMQEEPVSDTQSPVVFYGLTGSVGNTKEEPQVIESAEIQHKNKTCKENDDSLTSEDERIVQNLLSLWKEVMIEPTCCRFGLHKDEVVDFLKSLKDRVQPKQEWSEEDEKMIDNIIDTINMSIEDCDIDDVGTKARFTLEKERDWLKNKLKSLRHQSQWRPSDEQMEALEHFIVYHNGSTNYAKDLEELRLQLKKLMEE